MAANRKEQEGGRGLGDSSDKGWRGRGQAVERLLVSVAEAQSFSVMGLSSPWVGGCAGEQPSGVPESFRGA